jgi:hypothetical protein
MAMAADFAYLRRLIDRGLVQGPLLEVGSRSWQGETGNAALVCQEAGVKWEGADLTPGPGVDFQLDILDGITVARLAHRWKTVLLFNLLEHVYDPISALNNAMTLVSPGGLCIVATPVVWQLHDYPSDFWRPMPDFFLEFARRNGFEVADDTAMWLVDGAVYPMEDFAIGNQKQLPSYSRPGVFRIWGKPRAYWSRAVHIICRTIGTATPYPSSAIGIAIRRPESGIS